MHRRHWRRRIIELLAGAVGDDGRGEILIWARHGGLRWMRQPRLLLLRWKQRGRLRRVWQPGLLMHMRRHHRRRARIAQRRGDHWGLFDGWHCERMDDADGQFEYHILRPEAHENLDCNDAPDFEEGINPAPALIAVCIAQIFIVRRRGR